MKLPDSSKAIVAAIAIVMALAAALALISLVKPTITGNTAAMLFVTGNHTNQPPVLDSIGNLQAREGSLFVRQVTATDPENDNLTFSTNTSLFSIGDVTGLINFTPTTAQIGNYSINISVSDGNLTASEVINFTVQPGPFCGDSVCSGDENCNTCSTDCGACPSIPAESQAAQESQAAEGGGEAGGGAAARTRGAGPGYRCVEKWKCQDWSECSDGTQVRLCKDEGRCGTTASKPLDRRSCSGAAKPAQQAACSEQNCGGACPPCKEKLFASIPLPELKIPFERIAKQLPWALILAIILAVAGAAGADNVHLRRLRRLEMSVYRERLHKYKLIRRKMYRAILNVALITIVASSYYYWFSDCPDCLRRNIWMPAAIIAAIPLAVAVAIQKLEYSQYKRALRERRLRNVHERQIRQLAQLETKLSLDIEQELLKLLKAYELANPENAFSRFREKLEELARLHAAQVEYVLPKEQAINALGNAAKSKEMAKASKDSFELKQLGLDIKLLLGSFAESQEDLKAEKNFLSSMEDVASDRLLVEDMSKNAGLTNIYNELVDAYKSVAELHIKSMNERKREIDSENDLLKEISSLFDNSEEAEAHSADQKWVRIYNLFVDIYDHYKKKNETA